MDISNCEVCVFPKSNKRSRLLDNDDDVDQPHIPTIQRGALASHYAQWRHPTPLLVLYLSDGITVAGVFMINPDYDGGHEGGWKSAVRFGRVLDSQTVFPWLSEEWHETRNTDLVFAEFDLDVSRYENQIQLAEKDPNYPILKITLASANEYTIRKLEVYYDFYCLRRLGKFNPQLIPPPITWTATWISNIQKAGLW